MDEWVNSMGLANQGGPILSFPTSMIATTFGVNLTSLRLEFNARWPCPDYTTGG